jgi:hypothetical protein
MKKTSLLFVGILALQISVSAAEPIKFGRVLRDEEFKAPQGHTLIQRYDSTVKSKS